VLDLDCKAMKSNENILLQIKKSVKEIEPESEIILFGSRARGDEREDSDWDLLILVPYEAGLKEEQQFRHKLFDLELEFGQAISTLVKSKKEWESKYRITPLCQNILQEGIAI
jgi:predicted nucleotidyltransferase